MILRKVFLLVGLLFHFLMAYALPMGGSSVVTSEMLKTANTSGTVAEKAVADGFQALAGNDLKAAELAFAKALQLSPNLVTAMLGQSEMMLRRNRVAEALALLEEAAKQAPNSAIVQTALGRFYFSQKNVAKAEIAYKQAIKLDKSNLQANMDLGDLYLGNLGKTTEAITAFRGAIAARSDYSAAHFGLGMALLAAGDKRLAAISLEEAARISPKDPNPFHVLGRVQASEKKFDLAIKSLSNALTANPEYLPALLDRADIYAETNKNNEAVSDYQKILRTRPSDSVVLLKLGMIYQREQRINEAKSAYKAALKGNPNLPPAYNNLAMIALRENGSINEALNFASKAVQLAPKVPQFHDTLGRVHRALGDKAKAISSLETAARLEPPQAEILNHLGLLYEESNQPGKAIDIYRKALSIKGEHRDTGTAKSRIQALGG